MLKERNLDVISQFGFPPTESLEEIFAKLFEDVGKLNKFVCCAPLGFTKAVKNIEKENQLDIT